MSAASSVELGFELQINLSQMRYVRQSVGELLLGKRPPAPVGKSRRLVDILVGELLHEVHVAHRLAEPADHGRDLSVEYGVRDELRLGVDDLDVLPTGVEDLHHAFVRHQLVEGAEIQSRRKRIDDNFVLRARHLDKAQYGPVGLLAQELGVDGHKGVPGKSGTRFGEVGS